MIPLVSIIVPCYGVEKYLDRCMVSLINQTLRDIEIIMVDDSSPDRVPEMCDAWAGKDSRIKVIHKVVNEGLGMACNTGLDAATGVYVAFCDSDDWVDAEMYEVMYNAAKENDADAVFSGIQTVNQHGTVKPMNEPNQLEILDSKEAIHKHVMDIIAAEPSCKLERKVAMSAKIVLYKRKTIVDNDLHFVSERVLISEDLVWNIDVLCHSKKVMMLPKTFYYYYNNTTSISKRIRMDRLDFFKAQRLDLLSRTKRYGMPQKTDLRIERMFIGYCRFYIGQICNSNLSYTKKRELVSKICNDDMLQNVLAAYPVCLMPKSHRLMAWLMKRNSYFMMRLIYKIKK